MGQDGQKTGDLDNAARLPVKITVRIVEDADLLQLFEALANLLYQTFLTDFTNSDMTENGSTSSKVNMSGIENDKLCINYLQCLCNHPCLY